MQLTAEDKERGWKIDRATWMERWRDRVVEAQNASRDAFMLQLDGLAEKTANGDRMPRSLDPTAALEPELSCDAVESSPMPYVLNVGCGYEPTAVGQRTKGGVPLYVVGADPNAYPIGDALSLLATQFPAIGSARRFIMPIVGEELSMAVPAGSFHAVWSEHTILDCVDPLRFVQQCVRALRVGGVACIKFRPEPVGGSTLWGVPFHDGGKIMFESERGQCGIAEVRGERLELHTLLDGCLMIKVRRNEHAVDEAVKRVSKILTGGAPLGEISRKSRR